MTTLQGDIQNLTFLDDFLEFFVFSKVVELLILRIFVEDIKILALHPFKIYAFLKN